jgi:DNA uptake protein ComE-like DNA-binding protein
VPDWQRQIKEYLTFSSKERRGIFVLLILLVLLIVFYMLLPLFIRHEPTDFTEFEKQIALFEMRNSKVSDSLAADSKSSPYYRNKTKINLMPFEFDPNQLSPEKWRMLGLEDKQISVIRNYLNKGGRFRKKEDLAKMYTISEEEYRILEPYIKINSLTDQVSNTEIIKTLNPFPFDPNKLTKEQGLEMGLHEQVINAIIAYRQKGGQFKSSADLKKMYTLSEEEYAILEPFILIPEDTLIYKPTHTLAVVELNSADSLDLQQLPGIGPSFSRRIIKYRELLGGYSCKEQLLEVYGMDSTRYLAIANQMLVDKGKIRKININKITIKEMMKHPYIEFYVAKSIINYRNQKGAFADINEIREAKLIYQELYLKIEPYLSVN